MAASSVAVVDASSRGLRPLQFFPFRESGGPGPSPHVVLCAATGREGDVSFAIVFYTTSQTDHHGARRPRQYIFVDKARAAQLGQKIEFHVDASRIARLPLTKNYFPEMTGSTFEVRGHDPDFVSRVEGRLNELIANGFEITKVDAVTRDRK